MTSFKTCLVFLLNTFYYQNIVESLPIKYYSGTNNIGIRDNYWLLTGFQTQNGDVFLLTDNELYNFTYNYIEPQNSEFNFITYMDIQLTINIGTGNFPSINDVFYVFRNDFHGKYNVTLYDMNTFDIKPNNIIPYNDNLNYVHSPCMKIYNNYLIITGLSVEVNATDTFKFEVFSFNTNMWLDTPQTLQPHYRHSCEILNGKMYLFVGMYSIAIESYDLNIFNNLQLTSVSTQPWELTILGSIIDGLYGSRAITIGNGVYIIGGASTNFVPITNALLLTYIFTDIPSPAVTYGNILPVPRSFSTVFMVENRMFVFGGHSYENSNALNSYSYSDIFPTESPTEAPSMNPTINPTISPSMTPTNTPSHNPTPPSVTPSYVPSETPTISPSLTPTETPTISPNIPAEITGQSERKGNWKSQYSLIIVIVTLGLALLGCGVIFGWYIWKTRKIVKIQQRQLRSMSEAMPKQVASVDAEFPKKQPVGEPNRGSIDKEGEETKSEDPEIQDQHYKEQAINAVSYYVDSQ